MAHKILCQTPREFCSGGVASTSNGLTKSKNAKMHSSSEEAHACYGRYLVKTGHKRLSRSEYLQPEGGILVLTKPCRYGARLRTGKGGEGQTSNRWMPCSLGKSCRGGVIIG